VQTVPAAPGDVFLLCSAGLKTMVDDARIAAVLGAAGSMREAVRQLVDEANAAGGRDNVTALAFRLEDAAAPLRDAAGDATLVGAAAEEAGLTTTEVRRRAAAAAAKERRERLAARRPHRRLRNAAKVVAGLAVIAAIVFGAWYGNRQAWFLGTDGAGRVALYRGLPYELPLGIRLYSEEYASPLQTTSLPPRRRDAVSGQDVRSHSDAVSLLEEIERSQGLP
jgi:PPM family protein phosphatase